MQILIICKRCLNYQTIWIFNVAAQFSEALASADILGKKRVRARALNFLESVSASASFKGCSSSLIKTYFKALILRIHF